MAKVTSKYQVTVPKRIADDYEIRPGDEIDWVPAGEVIRLVPPGKHPAPASPELRLHWFDQATERNRKRKSVSRAAAQRGRLYGSVRVVNPFTGVA